MTRARLRQLLEDHGRDALSFLTLDPGMELHFVGDDACVAWQDTGTAWVTAGGPVAPAERVEEVVATVQAAAAGAGRRVVWFGVERRPEVAGLRALHVGEQPVWDPDAWPDVVAASRSLREQLRRARAKGVVVRQVDEQDLDRDSRARDQVEALVERWYDARAMAPMDFLVRVAPFARAPLRGLLLAEWRREGRPPQLVGILAAVPIPARRGLLLQDVLRDPEAPNGTMELLFDAALRRAAADGERFVTFGLAPLAHVPSRVLAAIRELATPLYDFEGVRRFKAKLRPSAWRPVYVLHDQRTSAGRAVFEVLRAFAGRGGLTGFAVRTLRHRAPTIAAVLAAGLVPWTALLMLADPRHFPAPWVRDAWVVADVVLGVGLTFLAWRWRPALARGLAVAAALDLALGLFQAVGHNLQHLPAGFGAAALDLAAISLSLLAPAFACWFLWSSARR